MVEAEKGGCVKTKPLLYIDLFCGAGGTTTGVLVSDCAHVVSAVNHDETAIADICMRPISVRESLRVMGFPEDYKLKGTQTQQRKFIGNAVEVSIAEHMVRALAASLRGVYQPQPMLF